MKEYYYQIGFLFFFIFFACNNPNKENKNRLNKECDSLLHKEKTITRSIPEFEVANTFDEFLDSIINNEKKCSFYSKCTSGFEFFVSKYETFYKIEITSINIYRYDYTISQGVFTHNEVRFIFRGLMLSELLLSKNENILIEYYDLDRSSWTVANDDRRSNYVFNYINRKVFFESHFECVQN